MWSPTTNTTSDNKKKEEVEDCRCNSGSDSVAVSPSASPATSALAAAIPQKLNTFETNSKKQSLPFGGNLSTASGDDQQGGRRSAKDKEFAFANEQGGDSGFISGPQTSELFQQEFDTDKYNSSHEITPATTATNTSGSASALPVQKLTTTAIATTTTTTSTSGDAQNNVQKYNIRVAPSVDQQQQKQKQQHQQDILDSGCIDVDEDDSADYTEHDEANVKSINEQKLATGAAQLQQQEQQINKTGAASVAASPNSDQMILKQNVDAGMSEWFCNLSLQTEPPPSSAQQSQHEIPTIGLNNLNGSGNTVRKSIPTSASAAAIIDGKSVNLNHSKQQQQQQSTGNTTSPTTTVQPTNVTPANAWEQFYQQNDDGDTPLHLACISGYVDVVAALMRMAPHPCLFNIQNDEAQTPLHLAALTAQPKILRMLLIAGAEPTIRDRNGNTALHLACISGEEQCVRALTIPISASEINEAHRQYGHRSNDKTVSYLSCARLPSDLEIRNYDGERCVHLAAQAGHIDILRILVLYGADINAREGKSGRTPLHIAIECCNEDLANFLLDECQKLNLETATYAGLTAYQVACILNKSQMQNILERRGAEPLTPPDSDYDSDIEDLDDSKIYDRFGDPGYFVNYNGGNPMTVA